MNCKINCNKNGKVQIGDYTRIREHTVLNCDNEIKIGKYCLIGDNVLIQDNDSHPESPKMRKGQAIRITGSISDTYESLNSPIYIDDCVWIGTGATILKGVNIGYGSIIGTQSVVTKDIPDMCLAVGNPTKIVKELKS